MSEPPVKRLEQIGKDHPILMWLAAIALGLLAVPAILYSSQGAVVLYQGF